MKRVKPALSNLMHRFLPIRLTETRYLAWVILAILLFGVVAASNLSTTAATPTPVASRISASLVKTHPALTPTPVASNTPTDTNGIIIGGVILVIIIIGGTLRVLRPRANE